MRYVIVYYMAMDALKSLFLSEVVTFWCFQPSYR